MIVEVVIPSAGDPTALLWSLGQQSRPPDQITVISNEWFPLRPEGSTVPIRHLRFTSEEYPYGYRDVVLRRNIGIWESNADAIIFQDDDQIAPRHLVRDMEEKLLVNEWAWGHHRYVSFDDNSAASLLDADPSIGKSRETSVNEWHSYQSGYAGCLGVMKSTILALGGFDMLFLGRHSNEDQNLANRMCGKRIKVWEPPFSWHPIRTSRRGRQPTNTCSGEHDWEPDVFNGVVFSRCSRCPLWKFSDREEHLFRDEVVVPYEHQLVEIVMEAI